MSDDPVAALVTKWEQEAARLEDAVILGDILRKDAGIGADATYKCADELREALKLRPRGSHEQNAYIEGLKMRIAELERMTSTGGLVPHKPLDAIATTGCKIDLK